MTFEFKIMRNYVLLLVLTTVLEQSSISRNAQANPLRLRCGNQTCDVQLAKGKSFQWSGGSL